MATALSMAMQARADCTQSVRPRTQARQLAAAAPSRRVQRRAFVTRATAAGEIESTETKQSLKLSESAYLAGACLPPLPLLFSGCHLALPLQPYHILPSCTCRQHSCVWELYVGAAALA